MRLSVLLTACLLGIAFWTTAYFVALGAIGLGQWLGRLMP